MGIVAGTVMCHNCLSVESAADNSVDNVVELGNVIFAGPKPFGGL